MYLTLNWFLLILTVFVMMGLGVYSARIVKKKGEGGFLLAATSLGAFVGASTIVATGFSGWGFMGSPGVAYRYGAIELLGNFYFAPAMVLAAILCARFFNQRAAELGSLTIPEFIIKNHEGPDLIKRLTQAICAIITITLLLVFLVGQLKALGLLAGQWLGIPPLVASFIMLVIIIGYTMVGGLAAVALTDTVMVIGMCISAIIIVVRIFADVSLATLLDQINNIEPALLAPADSTPYGSTKLHIFLILPYAFLYSTVTPHMSIRFMALRPDVKTHHLAAYMLPLVILLSLVPLAGLYTRVMIPGLENPDQAMPVFLERFLSPAVGAFITLFILFAMKSTTNSVLHALASSLSHDLRQAIWPKSTLSNTMLLRANRAGVVVLGLTGYVMLVYAPPFMLTMFAILGSGTLMASLVAPMLVRRFVKGDIYTAMTSIIFGFAWAAYFFLYRELGWMEAPMYATVMSSAWYVAIAKILPAIKERKRSKTT